MNLFINAKKLSFAMLQGWSQPHWEINFGFKQLIVGLETPESYIT